MEILASVVQVFLTNPSGNITPMFQSIFQPCQEFRVKSCTRFISSSKKNAFVLLLLLLLLLWLYSLLAEPLPAFTVS
jgi:hypothetical protein